MKHNEKKGLSVAPWGCDAEFHRKRRYHIKEAHR